MSESSEVVGGGTSASTAIALDASAVSSLVEEGGGRTTPEDAPLGRKGLISSEQPSTEGRWHLWERQHE